MSQMEDMVWLLLIFMEFNFIPNAAGTSGLFSKMKMIRMDRIMRALFRFVIMNGPALVANQYLKSEVWAILRVSAHCVYGCMTCATQYGPVSANGNLKCYCLFYNIARRDAAMVSWLVNFLAMSDNRFTCGGTLEFDTFWSPNADNKIYSFDCYTKTSAGHVVPGMENKTSLRDVLVKIRMDCKEFFKSKDGYESTEEMRAAATRCVQSWKDGRSILWGMPFRFTMPNALTVSTSYKQTNTGKTKDDTIVKLEVTTQVFKRGFNEMDEIEQVMKDSSNTTGSLDTTAKTTSSSTSMSSTTTSSNSSAKTSSSTSSKNSSVSTSTNTNTNANAKGKSTSSLKQSFLNIANVSMDVDDDHNKCVCDNEGCGCVCLFFKGKALNSEDLKTVLQQTLTTFKYSENNGKYDRESVEGEATCIKTLIAEGLIVDPDCLDQKEGCGSYVQMMIKILTVLFEANDTDGNLAYPERMDAWVRNGMSQQKNRMHAAGVGTHCKRLESTFGFGGTEEDNNTDGKKK